MRAQRSAIQGWVAANAVAGMGKREQNGGSCDFAERTHLWLLTALSGTISAFSRAIRPIAGTADFGGHSSQRNFEVTYAAFPKPWCLCLTNAGS